MTIIDSSLRVYEHVIHFKIGTLHRDQYQIILIILLMSIKLNISDHSIVVIDDKIENTTIVKPVPRCKICHEYQADDDKVRSYCKCKQNQHKMHERCLKQSLQKKINRVINIDSEVEWKNKLVCQHCDFRYYLDYDIKRQCTSYEILRQGLKKQRFIFGLCALGILLSILGVILCSTQYNSANQDRTKGQQTLLIFLIILSSALMLFCIYKIITIFIFKKLINIEISTLVIG